MSTGVKPQIAAPRQLRRLWRWLLWAAALFLVGLLLLFKWGGYLLVGSDQLPQHADVAVVLQGSIAAEIARVAGAMELLRQGEATRVMLSVPHQSYWGQAIAPAAHEYLVRNYGAQLATAVDFCETGPDVNSTADEARVLTDCIKTHGWNDVVVVTSDYHTRRADMIWTNILEDKFPNVHLWIHGVADPEFDAHAWWRTRRSAKTWFMELLKLIWTTIWG